LKILLVSPKTPVTFWSLSHVLPFLSRKSANPPLGLLTVAAFLPRHWELRLIDMDIRELEDDDILWADYVLAGGMYIHRQSIHEIARRCRETGTPLIVGGPLITTGRDDFPEISHVVLGEAEELMPQLIADMEAGEVEAEYRAECYPSLDHTPPPRWDLVDVNDYATMMAQFSRGCPFNCEFCDVIVLNGRVPRTKSPSQLLAELDALVVQGWKGPVFIVDDNFIGHRRKVKELLEAIVEWRERVDPPLTFLTEASVNLADDPGLMELMVRAGFKKVFTGIETTDEESLAEAGKVQNAGRNMVDAVHRIQAAGMEVMGGFIVGFDNDKSDVFRTQFHFIQAAGIGTAMVGLLEAMPRTRLFQRLKGEGRILEDACSGDNTSAHLNFIPKLDSEFLLTGYRNLLRRLYEPGPYYERGRTFLRNYRTAGPREPFTRFAFQALLRSCWVVGIRSRGRMAYWRFLGYALLRHPRAIGPAVGVAILGHHFRIMARGL
jgi:radical SAM superfamily enzyme YgiQ (UPF0313 family)